MLAGLTLGRPRAETLSLKFIKRLSNGGKVVDKFTVVAKKLNARLQLANLGRKTHLPYYGNLVRGSSKAEPTHVVSKQLDGGVSKMVFGNRECDTRSS
jgi:hypothetical protein